MCAKVLIFHYINNGFLLRCFLMDFCRVVVFSFLIFNYLCKLKFAKIDNALHDSLYKC